MLGVDPHVEGVGLAGRGPQAAEAEGAAEQRGAQPPRRGHAPPHRPHRLPLPLRPRLPSAAAPPQARGGPDGGGGGRGGGGRGARGGAGGALLPAGPEELRARQPLGERSVPPPALRSPPSPGGRGAPCGRPLPAEAQPSGATPLLRCQRRGDTGVAVPGTCCAQGDACPQLLARWSLRIHTPGPPRCHRCKSIVADTHVCVKK